MMSSGAIAYTVNIEDTNQGSTKKNKNKGRGLWSSAKSHQPPAFSGQKVAEQKNASGRGRQGLRGMRRGAGSARESAGAGGRRCAARDCCWGLLPARADSSWDLHNGLFSTITRREHVLRGCLSRGAARAGGRTRGQAGGGMGWETFAGTAAGTRGQQLGLENPHWAPSALSGFCSHARMPVQTLCRTGGAGGGILARSHAGLLCMVTATVSAIARTQGLKPRMQVRKARR